MYTLNLLLSSHDEYGLGYRWNPASLTVRVGDTVHWSWTGSSFTTQRGVAEVNSPGEVEYNGVGFRSRQSITGNFSHTFTTPGTYYYITEGYGHIGIHYLIVSYCNFKAKYLFSGFNGSITVVDMEDIAAELSIRVGAVVVNTSILNITCGDTASPFQSYTYSAAATPVIQSVTPAVTVGDSIDLVLTGLSDLAEDNVFVFGGQAPATCISSNFSGRTTPLNSTAATRRTYLASTEVQCTVPNLSPGRYRPILHVAGRGWGYASLDNSVIHIHPRIDAISETSGSLRGGTSLTVHTTGIAPSDIAKTRVYVGNTPCSLQSIDSGGQLVCTTQASRDNGYSSVVDQDMALAYWSLQADYYRSSGSYLNSDGEQWFRSSGVLGDRANASIFGTVMTRQMGISGNSATDQAAFFQASYMQTPVLSEFSDAAGFAMDLWIKMPQAGDYYQIIVDSSNFDIGAAASAGYLLMLNPCTQLEFWLATGVSAQNYTTNSSLECELVRNSSQCSQGCSGYLNVLEGSELPAGVWSIIQAEYTNLSVWQYVHFGWAADSSDDCYPLDDQCSGLQVLYSNNLRLEERTTYRPPVTTPVSIGGSSRSPLTLSSSQALGPFEGYLDEVAFYSRPLHSRQIQIRIRYGTTESQPVWITVNGEDGVGQGNVPNIVYSIMDQGFINDTVVNWDAPQDMYLEIEESTSIRFEWTGYEVLHD